MLSNLLNRTTLLAGLGLVMVGASPAAFAQADTDGNFSQQGAVELTFDHADTDQDVVAATVEYGAALRFAEGWRVQMDAVLEPVQDPVGDAAFTGQDAFIETLSVAYAGEGFTVYAGKINPVFGSAADLAPGIYGADVGESYQITEQVGVGGDILLPAVAGLAGEHVMSAALFAADRSELSGSLLGKRERLRLADGGIGNTESLKSFALSLDGALENGLGYSVGYRSLASDTAGEADETAMVAGVSYAWEDEAGWTFGVMAEVAFSRDADGVAGAKRDFYTAGATFGVGDWFFSGVVSGWDENPVAGSADLRKYELSVGRGLAEGVTLDFAVQDARAEGENETVFGARLTFEFG
jgi:hypothetical protein